MTGPNSPAAERLSRAVQSALTNAGIAPDGEAGAGLAAIGVALLRVAGLSRDDVLGLVGVVYDATPDAARCALEPDE